jgi:hypothetical protein
MSANTINHIFGIGYTMSADANNVSGIWGGTPRHETLIMVKFWFAPSGCPSFPPSAPSPPSMPCHRCHLPRYLCCLPRCRLVPAFGLDATGSALIAPSLTPSRQSHCLPRLRPRRRWQCPHHHPRAPSPSSTPPPSTSCHRRCLPRCLCRLPRCCAIAPTPLLTPPGLGFVSSISCCW